MLNLNVKLEGKAYRCVLEPNREDRARYVTLVHYIPEPGWCAVMAAGGQLRVVPLRRTLEWILVNDQWRLSCVRSTILRWDQVRPGRYSAELQAEWSEHVRGKDAVKRLAGTQASRKAV
jgi:hypothetical protein